MAKRKVSALSQKLIDEFTGHSDPKQSAHLMRFFKTGPGQYGEGDRFLGIKVPVTRSLIKPYCGKFSYTDYATLLASQWHEIRFAALLLMVDQAKRHAKQNDTPALKELVDFYDLHLHQANNWDLIDLSAKDIMYAYWSCARPKKAEIRAFLEKWAGSDNLWRQRAAVLATFALLHLGSLDETFWMAEFFRDHPHDLMHKACGWMLREAGKRDLGELRRFLQKFHTSLPRTALRYAIEHLDPEERKRWLGKGK